MVGYRRINNETEEANLKASPRKKIIKWILDARASLPSEMIKESFKHYAFSPLTKGSRDDLIHCFKKGQQYFQDHEVLRLELMIWQYEENPFEDPSESEVVETYESL